MTIFRVFWALFLSGTLACAFHRSWKWEHGTPMPETIFGGDKPRTKETAVWLDPSFLPVMLLLILVLFGAARRMDGVRQFLSLSLDVMILISFYFLLLIFLLPVFRKYFSARACATMWILPVYMFWQAHILLRSAPVPTFVFYIPTHILEVLFLIWVAGFFVVFLGNHISHFIFRHKVLSASYPVRNAEITNLFQQELNRLEYYNPVDLVISAAVTAPLSMGTTKRTRVTVLPDRAFTQQELQFIFRHEIHHLQRRDVNNKIFFAFCQALCWFNPLIWIATRKASDDLELSCDEIVLEDMDEQQRRQYAELLLDSAGHSGGFTTCLSAAAETMRYRLKNVVTVRNRLPGTLLLSVAMFLCVISYGITAISTDRGTVADLITGQRTAENIRSVYYQSENDVQFREVFAWDGESLFSYLVNLETEKLSSANEIHPVDRQGLSIVIDGSGTMEVIFYDRLIEVHHYHQYSHPEYYYLRSDLDWGIISRSLDLNAERPTETRLLDPQMQVHFDVAEMADPIVAVRQKFRAWDTETGETLRASNNSDSPGGLHGWNPTQAQLIFDMPVSEITVWMREWDSESQTTVDLEVENDSYFLSLSNRSAHYQVDVLYEPYNGILYEGTYVFDVEYYN